MTRLHGSPLNPLPVLSSMGQNRSRLEANSGDLGLTDSRPSNWLIGTSVLSRKQSIRLGGPRIFHQTDGAQVGLESRGSPKPGWLYAGDRHHLKWAAFTIQRTLTGRATGETGAKTRSSQKQKACGFHPRLPSLLRSLESLPSLRKSARKRWLLRDHLAAPSWLLILPAHSVVACAWEEP